MNNKRRRFSIIHRSDGFWQWRVGESFVVIYKPNGDRLLVNCAIIADVDDWERACHKGYGEITPSMVKSWIDSTFGG